MVDLDRMTDLSRDLRARLARDSPSRPLESSTTCSSEDGTRKFELELADGRRIESVFIPDTPAMTFCVSTQVGLRDGVRILPDGADGAGAPPDGRGDRRTGAGARPRDGPARRPVQHRADGDGRAAAQLRQHDAGAAHAPLGARPRGVAAPHHAVDRRPRARRSSGWRTSR